MTTLSTLWLPRALALVAGLALVALLATLGASGQGTPTPFNGTPAASPVASPRALTPTIVATTSDQDGKPVGGGCWDLIQDDTVVATSCDSIEEQGEFGLNGGVTFLRIPAGTYTLVLTTLPEGYRLAEDGDAGLEREVVFDGMEQIGEAFIVERDPLAATPEGATPVAGTPEPATPSPATPEVGTPATLVSLEATPSMEPATPAPSTPSAPTSAIVSIESGQNLNCRAEPSLDGVILTVLLAGTVVELRGEEEDGWTAIRCDGFDGWVASEFLEPVSPATPAAARIG